MDVGSEGIPDILLNWLGPGKLVHGLTEFRSPSFVILLPPCETHDAEGLRHQLLERQVVESGNQLARGQIAGGTKDDHGAGLGGSPGLVGPGHQQLVEILRFIHTAGQEWETVHDSAMSQLFLLLPPKSGKLNLYFRPSVFFGAVGT